MVEVKVESGGSVSTQTVDESRFGERVLVRTLKDAVVMYEANLRQGNAKTKSRGEVAGPNCKMWKQKHTGRARMGSKKVVHWRGGGTAFGPKPRDYSYHMPTKARRLALRTALARKPPANHAANPELRPLSAPSSNPRLRSRPSS